MVYFLSSAEDNASHFAMFQYNWVNKAAPYFNSDTTGLIGSLNYYPQGIHTSAAYTLWSIFGDQQISITNLLRAYYVVMVMVSVSLVFVCSELIGKLLAGNRFRYLGMIIGAITIFTGAILHLAGWGFLTQIIALVYVIGIALLLLHKRTLSKSSPIFMRLAEISLYGLLVIGLILSWYLLLFVAFILLVQRLIHLLGREWQTYVLTACISIVAVLPITLNFFTGKGGGSLNAPGGVYVYGILAALLLVITAGLAAFSYITKKSKSSPLPSPLILLLVSSYLMFIVIGSYQFLTAGTFLYYFHKSLYLAFIAAVIVVIYITVKSWASIKQRTQIIALHITCFILFGVGYFLINPTYPIVFFNNWFWHAITPQDISPAIKAKEETSKTTDVIYQSTCNYINEYILNRWTGALYLSENSERSSSMRDAVKDKKGVNISNEYLKKYPNTTIVNQTCS